MKNKKLFITIASMVLATVIAMVSCKKEIPNALQNNSVQQEKAFVVPDVDDMNAYLKDFKQRMLSSTKGDDETLSLDEAAWHISSLANYDFGHANVEYDDVRFDTLCEQVNITNGKVLLYDLASAYDNISTNIDKFYHSIILENKHFRFINVFINEDGKITVSLLTTFTRGSKYLSDTCWYYGDEWYAYNACYYYFDLSSYPVSTLGTSELEYNLNLVAGHPNENTGENVYYTYSFTKTFYYRDYIDPFGSPSYMNSRLFASNTYLNPDIADNICYYFDSYLGLGRHYCPADKCILSIDVDYVNYEDPFQGEHFYKSHHQLSVNYGVAHSTGTEPGPGNY